MAASEQPYQIGEVVSYDNLSAPRERVFSYEAALNRLLELEIGQGFRVDLGGIPLATFRSGIGNQGYRHGFRASVRSIGGAVYVFKMALREAKSKWHSRNAEIVDAVSLGERLEDVSAKFGITRQRVEQIVSRHEHTGNNVTPGKERLEAATKFIEPYLAALKPDCCVLCKAATQARRGPLCSKCKQSIKMLRDIKSRLRGYQAHGKRYYIANAAYLIRRHNVQPSDLERV